MGNVLVQEDSLRAIADAIRAQNGSEDTYTPAEMAEAVAAIAPVLLEKVFTENGIYSAASEGANGYSEVTVDVPVWMAPYAYDIDTGYVNAGVWTLGGDTVNYSDVYRVQAGHRYLISMGSVVGTRFRGMFSVEDTVHTTAKITGISVVNKTDPTPGTFVFYTAPDDGYITITKDNTGVSGLKTFIVDVTTD
jgi:hypothetical protein